MSAAGDVPERVFGAAFALPVRLAAAGFGVAISVIVLAVHPREPPETLTGAVAAAALVAVIVAVLLHLARCRVTASASALVVVQPAWRYVIPWRQVADVVAGGDGGLRIVLAVWAALTALYVTGWLIAPHHVLT